MRILVVSSFFDTHRGGLEIVAGQLARVLATEQQYQVTWVAADITPTPCMFPGNCVPLKCSNLTESKLGFPFPILFPSAMRLLWNYVLNSDAVLAHDALYPITVFAFLAAKSLKKPIIIVQHIGLIPYINPLLRIAMIFGNRFIAAPILSRANQVVFISGLAQSYFSRLCFFQVTPCLIFNGLCGVFTKSTIKKKQRTASSFEEKSHLNIGFVGRFVEKKGIHVIRMLAEEMPEIHWILAGWGENYPEKWGFNNVEVRRNLNSYGVFKLYKEIDLLILPSVGEGLPLVVQEALASGTRVLCGEDLLLADPWLEEYVEVAPVEPYKPRKTADVWKKKISECVSQTMTHEINVDAVHRRYNWSNAARQYSNLLKSIIKS